MTSQTEKANVLIVDDIPENLDVLEKLLHKLDVDIIRAGSGNEALRATLYHDISLILLDIMMPGMNGIEVAEMLKQDDGTAEIPIIFVTAMDKDESWEMKAYSKGAVDFLYKPFNTFVLLSKVKVLLDLYSMKKNIEQAIFRFRQSTEKPKLLVVDDNPENILVLKQLLKRLDVDVISAESGNEALAKTLYNDFALIFLDVQMPGMDGYEVAELLKSDEKTAGIPIIFITAIDRDDAKEIKGYGKGAVDFIFKPFNEFILLSKTRVFLEIYRLRIGLEALVAERTSALKKSNKKLKEEIARKEIAEKELIKTKSYLSSVVNSMSSIIIGADTEGIITDMNREAVRISGVSSKDAQGKSIAEVFPFFADITKELLESASRNEPVEKTKVSVRINDVVTINNFAVYPLIGDDVNQLVIRADDVTDRIKFEEMMIQSEKMMTVGGLAAGMAHEINNPIAGIIQNLQVVQNRIRPDMNKNIKAAGECGTTIEAVAAYLNGRDIDKILQAAIDSGSRAAKIIQNMLSFSRKGEGYIRPHNLCSLLDQTIEMAGSDYELKKRYDFRNIRIIREYEEDMPDVMCEGSKIQQVFLNLFKNGAQAMFSENGKTQATDGDAYVPQFILRVKKGNDGMAHIEIEDNGPGMDEQVRKSVFEPFFTTKPVGDGTGLGLFVSYFIITENHKGILTVESFPGKGAKFIIRLPLKSE